ncbi:unnamed protein product [Amoebophrya sp. A120]|nr:unnamed protein product [Amoebophrya sp. A120]|eukprot:GSA120T00007922001.1
MQQIDCLLAVLVALLGVQVYQISYIQRLKEECRCDYDDDDVYDEGLGGGGSRSGAPYGISGSAGGRGKNTAGAGSTSRSRQLQAPEDEALLQELEQLTKDQPVSPPPTSTVTQATTVNVNLLAEQPPPPQPPLSSSVSNTSPGGGIIGSSSTANGGGAGGQLTLKQYLQRNLPHGLGIFLGVGTSTLPMELLRDWSTSPGLYLVDPYIHIWAGYDDPANLSDKDHQRIFERHQIDLKPYENRFSFVRDFSHSFVVTYKGTPGSPPTSLLYIDNTQTASAIVRDLNDWWDLVAPGGIAAGPQYNQKPEVAKGVQEFAAKLSIPVQLFADQQTWYLVK